jgi:hypothetical protein
MSLDDITRAIIAVMIVSAAAFSAVYTAITTPGTEMASQLFGAMLAGSGILAAYYGGELARRRKAKQSPKQSTYSEYDGQHG